MSQLMYLKVCRSHPRIHLLRLKYVAVGGSGGFPSISIEHTKFSATAITIDSSTGISYKQYQIQHKNRVMIVTIVLQCNTVIYVRSCRMLIKVTSRDYGV